MKFTIESGDSYPHLFMYEPVDEYGRSRAFDVPDDLGDALVVAQRSLHEAEQAVLVWLRDVEGLSPESDILANHLDGAKDRGRSTTPGG